MLIRRPRGTTQVLNKNHEDGFLPLPIRVEAAKHNGAMYRRIVTAWEMTPEEIKQVQEGGCIEVGLLIPQMVGIMLEVVPAADPIKLPELEDICDQIKTGLNRLRAFYVGVLDEQQATIDSDGLPKDPQTYYEAIEVVKWVNSAANQIKEIC